MIQNGSEMTRNGAQMIPKCAPNVPQKAPSAGKSFKRHQNGHMEAPRRPKMTPKGTPKRPQNVVETGSQNEEI